MSMMTCVKGSRENKFVIISVKAPGWQGVKVQEYQSNSKSRGNQRKMKKGGINHGI
jgi:hypothetical protein